MAIKYGKTQVKQMVDAIDQDHETVEDAALAALEAAEIVLEDRAKFIVVGQLLTSREKGALPPSSPDAIKVALGYYSTEGDAVRAAESLWHSSSTGDTFATWVLPMFYGTPSELHTKQKEKYTKAALAAKEKSRIKIREDNEKRRQAAEVRANGGKGSCETCGHQPYEHSTAGVGRGACYLANCHCEKWKERLK